MYWSTPAEICSRLERKQDKNKKEAKKGQNEKNQQFGYISENSSFWPFGNFYRTSFLFGVKTLMRAMRNPVRRTTVIVFFGSMASSIFLCIFVRNKIARVLTMMLSLVQMCSYWWYTLSYIPYARKFLKCCCRWLFEGIDDV